MNSINPALGDPNEFLHQHTGLVQHMVNRYQNIAHGFGVDRDDLVSVATIGMWKAYKSFNPDKGAKWSSYAVQCIDNELKMQFRKERKHQSIGYLEHVLNVDSVGNELTVLELFAVTDDQTSVIVQEFLETLVPREREILRLLVNGMHQTEVGKRIGISQPFVSRLLGRIRNQFVKGEWRQMATINLSREAYLEQRLTGKIRGKIAEDLGVPLSALLSQLSKWHLRDLKEEKDLLERMRVQRGIPQTEAPVASVKPNPTSQSVQPAHAPTQVPQQASVIGGFDLSKVKWIPPIATRVTSLVSFNAHGLRVSGWVADKFSDIHHVQIGFINGLLVVNPGPDGWRIKRSKKTTSCYLGSGRVLKAAQQAGFNPKAELKPEWHPQGFLIIQQVR